MAALAADSMTFAITEGLEMKLTWLALISVVLAPIRFAMNRSKSGLMAWSCVETTYQEGMLFHAAALMGSPKMDAARGFCVAASTEASPSGKSLAKTDLNLARSMNRKPAESGATAVPKGEGENLSIKAPTASPASGAKAAT